MNAQSGLAFCIVLALAAVAAALLCGRARPAARIYARFAFALYFALALAGVAAMAAAHPFALQVSHTLARMVAALAPAALALAVISARERPPAAPIAIAALAGACLCALAATMFAIDLLAFAPLLLSAIAIVFVSLHRWRGQILAAVYAIVSAFAMVAGAASLIGGGDAGAVASALFSAAALLGFSLALARRSGAPAEPPRRRKAPVVSIRREG